MAGDTHTHTHSHTHTDDFSFRRLTDECERWQPCAMMMAALGKRSGSCGKKAVVSTQGMREVPSALLELSVAWRANREGY